MEGIMKVTIYDNDGKTQDRYTVILKDDSVYDMSADPLHLLGICQYCGKLNEMEQGLSHTGRLIRFADLPKAVKLAIRQRQNPDKYLN